MSRNKYPEETVAKIMEVSFRLFAEKGYDHTTIQDIVDALGMSKGAVYHHFKSKAEILERLNRDFYDAVNWYEDIHMDPSLTGLQKLRRMLMSQFQDERKIKIDSIPISMEKNPQMLMTLMRSTLEESAPFLQRFIEEGLQDGSICTTMPKELSEVLVWLMNTWIGVFTHRRDDYVNKIAFLRLFTESMGLYLFDDTLYQCCIDYYDHAMSGNERM